MCSKLELPDFGVTKRFGRFSESSSLLVFQIWRKGRVRKSVTETTNRNSADETIGRRVVVECLSGRLALSRKPLTPNTL